MDEQQEALKRIHDKMIFDCLNEALDSKRVLGLKGCPLPVDLVSLFNQHSRQPKKNKKFLKLKESLTEKSKSSNIKNHLWKSQNSKSDNFTDISGKKSQVKNSISRSQTKYSALETNKENQMENSGVSSNPRLARVKTQTDPLVKIFEKTSDQIKKWGLFMCGMYEHKPENFKYFPEIVNPMIFERIKESRMNLLEMNEMEELGIKMSDFDDEKYEIMLNLNDLVLDHLLSDLCQDFGNQGSSQISKNRTSLSRNLPGIKREGSSNVIATEDVLTKLDYFPNYSYMKTDRSHPSNTFASESIMKTDEKMQLNIKKFASSIKNNPGIPIKILKIRK